MQEQATEPKTRSLAEMMRAALDMRDTRPVSPKASAAHGRYATILGSLWPRKDDGSLTELTDKEHNAYRREAWSMLSRQERRALGDRGYKHGRGRMDVPR